MNKQQVLEAQQQVKEIARALKKSLKVRSKSELINIIIVYASDLQEMQQVAQQLFEENTQLKAQLGVENTGETHA